MKKTILLLTCLFILNTAPTAVSAQSASEQTFTQTVDQLSLIDAFSEDDEMDKYSQISSVVGLIDDGIESIEALDDSVEEKEKWVSALKAEAIAFIGNVLSEGPSNEVNGSAPANATAEVPQEYKNALTKAETYVSMMSMSKMGIYEQLTSVYGDSFPEEAAQYAIDTLDADWNEAAFEKAKLYYEVMAMSKDAIYEQLISDYGDQFTAEQAQYAVDNLD